MATTFTKEQQEAIQDRSQSLLVAAAAGSGKTRVLVERLLDQVEAGANIGNFLIITYTRAAAAELKGRILEELKKREGTQNPSRHLRRQSAMLYNADIGTIHAFCGKIVREFAHVLDQNPDFKTADEDEGKRLLYQAIEDTLEQRYESIDEYPDFEELVDTVSEGRQDEALIEIVRTIHEKLLSHPYPAQWAHARMAELDITGKKDGGETPWGAYLLEGARKAGEYWLQEMTLAKAEFVQDEAFTKAYGPSWDETIGGLTRFLAATKKGWDETVAAAEIPFPRTKPAKGDEYERYKDLRRRCKSAADKLTEDFTLRSKDLFDDIKATRPAQTALIKLVQDVDHAYKKEKTRRGLLDFTDLEHLAVKLLVDPETGAPTKTAEEIASRYQEMMVDEFQDVSAVQDLIFRAIAEYGPRRFMVGDVKQSIYRFRLADPAIFLSYYRKFPLKEKAEGSAACKILLGKNFRSRPAVLESVNFLFRRIMSEQFGEMEYGDEEALYPGRTETKDDAQAVEFDLLDLHHLPKDSTDDREMAEARHVAARIRTLHEQEGYDFRDCAILLKSFRSKVGRYEKALEEAGIPVAKSGGDSFFYTPEVASVIALLAAIQNPLQDVPLIALLRSPLFGFKADELAEIRLAQQGTSFYEALEHKAEDDEKCAQFIKTLNRYRDDATDMPIDRFLWYIVQDTDAMSLFGAKAGGEAKLQNLRALLAFAQSAAAQGYRNLFDFVLLLEKRMEGGKAPGIPSSEGTGDAVTIMSVHKSKGLEFQVVFLPELAGKFNHQDRLGQILVHPDLGLGTMRREPERKIRYTTLARAAISKKLKQEMLAEELRILYVAMTRAEARLIMVASSNDAEKMVDSQTSSTGGKLSPYVLETASTRAHWILLASLSEERPPWKLNQITCRPHVQQGISGEAVQAGSGKPNPPSKEFIRRMEYAYPHQAAVELPSKLTATGLKGRTLDHEVQEAAENYQIEKRRPIFRRPGFIEENRPLTPAERGTATHLVMQYIDFRKCTSHASIAAEITRLAQKGHITSTAAKAVQVAHILHFFQSPLGKRVQEAETLKREFKFSLLVPAADLWLGEVEEDILLQGVIDCYLEEGAGITVVDFKTDYVPEGGLEQKAQEYKGQMQAYAYALEKITGKEVKENILYFFSTGEGVRL